MPETKFTPGPWDFDRHTWWENTPGDREKQGCLIVYPTVNPDGDDLTIAEVNDFFDKEVGKANALLIASAPCLYTALEGLLSIHDSVTQQQERELREKWIEAAHAALRKARGAS